MSYFVVGEWDNGGFRVFSSEHRMTIGVSRETMLKNMSNAEFKNAVFDGEKVRERQYRGVKRIGNFSKGINTRVIVALDFTAGKFGYVTGHLGKKVEVGWKDFKELPYYDKYTNYGSIYFVNATGEVFKDAYDIIGEPYPIYFKTYVKNLVTENSVVPCEGAETTVEASEVGEEAPVQPEYVNEEKSLGVESTEDIRDLVNKMVRWGKGETNRLRNISEIDIYKVLLLSQMDDSILYIPYAILKEFKYTVEHILDRNMDMTMFVAIGTLKIDGRNLIIIAKYEEKSHLVKLHIVKSSRPEKDKNYDIGYIKENYIKINLLSSTVRM